MSKLCAECPIRGICLENYLEKKCPLPKGSGTSKNRSK